MASFADSRHSDVATGLEMYDALKNSLAERTVPINQFDAEDLMKLTADDLRARGIDSGTAERVARDLAAGSLAELGNAISAKLTIEQKQPNLIPLEGIRRSAGALADEEGTLEEMFEELDRIRHPERYAV
ncbi:MAG TPA: hypothetical protein PK867_03515 [Pirellulales bacterium]|nr:hypothetical protein [Pirellulales bacterium]